MAEQKDGESFFRKVVRFDANPTTDWADLNSRQEESGAGELEKSELKAMVERKRRNDFVRKREFDMLRRVRREGLSPEQLAALGGSSKLDDSEVRSSDIAARPDVGVKAKIDEIEQQMVGERLPGAADRPPGFFDAPTEPAHFPAAARTGAGRLAPAAAPAAELPPLPPLPDLDLQPPAPPVAAPAGAAVMAAGLSPLAPSNAGGDLRRQAGGPSVAVEVSEVVHDPELDEAVIAFANADFQQCEQSLSQLISAHGERAQHAETWLVLFDLYRATGQQPKFEALALDYAQRFGWSAPQWFSLPKLVSDAVADERPKGLARVPGDVGWVCPQLLDVDAVARLRSQTLQMPLPWVFDWAALMHIDAEAASGLTDLMRQWARQPLEMRWLAGERLFAVLQEVAPTGVRDADPAFWGVRLEALRLANRPDQFDEAAIDYCVTYEVSPPSWERARCNVNIGGTGHSTHAPALSRVSEVSTSFFESSLGEEAHGGTSVRVASLELSGQLIGGIDETLRRLDAELGPAAMVNVTCARLIRVDFIAAGDLLNWVLAKRGENRQVGFSDAHRLVALFFGAMGINEHARVRVRNV
jgi:hypothetical protein